MSWDLIRNQITTVLSGITNIGNVYKYMPDVRNDEEIASLLKNDGTGDIRFWVVQRKGGEDIRGPTQTIPLTQSIRRHRFRVLGFMSYQDNAASEDEFQELVDDVIEAFAPAITLSETAEVVYGATFECREEMVGRILLRVVEISLTADERVNRTYA